MKITIVAFEGCMTSAVYGQADAFAIALRRRRHALVTGSKRLLEAPDNVIAYERVESYADRLWLLKASGAYTGVPELENLVKKHIALGDSIVLFVDYLQKVSVALIAAAGVVAVAWRCPKCGDRFGFVLNPRECPRCHADLGAK